MFESLPSDAGQESKGGIRNRSVGQRVPSNYLFSMDAARDRLKEAKVRDLHHVPRSTSSSRDSRHSQNFESHRRLVGQFSSLQAIMS